MVNISGSEQIPGLRKAAILMVMIGDEASSAILRQLDSGEVDEISREIARVQALTPEEAEGVLEEFHHMVTAHDYVIKGGIDYARRVLVSAFGDDQAQRMLDRLMKSLGNEALSFDALQKTDPQQLSKFIHSEHPQTIALILSHLNPSQAAALLSSLPKELRGDVATRMASLDQISPDIITKIASVIGLKLRALGEMSRESYGGVDAVAEMLNRLDSNATKDILEAMETSVGVFRMQSMNQSLIALLAHQKITEYVLKHNKVSGKFFVVLDGQDALDYLFHKAAFADPEAYNASLLARLYA